jgi:hypothetical protein
MEVAYKEAPDFDVPSSYFLLPQSNTIVHVLRRDSLNFDKQTLRGYTSLLQRALKERAGDAYKIILLNVPQMLSKEEHKSRVSFITGSGILPPSGKTTFDFSHLEKIEKSERRKSKEGSSEHPRKGKPCLLRQTGGS